MVAGLALLVIAVAAPAASAAPWPCDATGYALMISSGGAGDTGFGPFERQPNGSWDWDEIHEEANVHINALGFRPQDGFMYAYNNNTDQVIRIESDGAGGATFTPMPTTGLPTPFASQVGTVLANGLFFMWNLSNQSQGVLVDVSGPAATVVSTVTATFPTSELLFGDMAVNPADDKLYAALSPDASTPSGIYELVLGGTAPNMTLTLGQRVAAAGGPATPASSGAQWFSPAGANGTLYQVRAAQLYATDLATGVTTPLGSIEDRGRGDGASCPNTLEVSKDAEPRTVTAGGELTYTYTVTARGILDPNPVQFVDTLPAGFTYVPGGVTVNGTFGTPNAYGGTNRLEISGAIPRNTTVTITARVAVSEDHVCGVDVDNQAQATLSVPGLPPVTVDSDDPTTPANPIDPTTVRVVCEPNPWSCGSAGLLFNGPRITGIDLATGATSPLGNTGPYDVNAVGFNPRDNFIYGWSNAHDNLVRIHRDGRPEFVDPTPPLDPDDFGMNSVNVGDFDPQGYLYLSGPNPLHYWKVDLTDPASPTYGEVVDEGTVQLAGGTNMVADWVWIDGALWGVAANLANPTAPARLVRVDPANGQMTVVAALEGLPSEDPDGGTSQYGAVFTDAQGYLYAYHNFSGRVYRIVPDATGTYKAISQGPERSAGDGARCPSAVVPTIVVTKTVAGRVRAADEFTVALVEDTGRELTAASTSGGATSASTDDQPVSEGRTYTITDASATGSPTPIDEYVASMVCTDTLTGQPVASGGAAPNFTFTVVRPSYFTCEVTNRPVADLVQEKSASPSPVVPGGDIAFTLRVTNNGPSTSVGETVTDQLPAEVTFSSASEGCSEAGGTVTCAVGDLAPGASRTFTITGRVASNLRSCLQNSATVSGRFDPNMTNNTAAICTPLRPRSDLQIIKDPSSATVAAGGQVMYTLVVRNNGPSDDPDVSVSDPLAAGLTLASAEASQGTCSTANNRVSCELGGLRAGGSAQVLVTATAAAPATATAGGCAAGSTANTITNTASVIGANQDPDPDNNRDPAQICVEVPPDPPAMFDLQVEKRASATRPYIGQRVTYRIVVRNNGPAAAPGVTMTDTLNAPVRVVSVRATQGSCQRRIPMRCELGTIAAGDSVTIRIVAKHRETGCRQRQAASAMGDGTDSNPANNMDTVAVCVRKVRLQLSKVANRSTVLGGETLSYRIRVRNPTRGEARNVRLCDRLPSGLSFVSSKPRAQGSGRRHCWRINRLGARATRTYRVTARAARGALGRKVNTATLTSPDIRRRMRARDPIRVLGQATPVTG